MSRKLYACARKRWAMEACSAMPTAMESYVQHHSVGVARRDVAMAVVAVRHHPQKHQTAGHALQDIGEVFGPHDWRSPRDVIVDAEKIGCDRTGEINKAGVVDRNRISPFDRDIGLT